MIKCRTQTQRGSRRCHTQPMHRYLTIQALSGEARAKLQRETQVRSYGKVVSSIHTSGRFDALRPMNSVAPSSRSSRSTPTLLASTRSRTVRMPAQRAANASSRRELKSAGSAARSAGVSGVAKKRGSMTSTFATVTQGAEEAASGARSCRGRRGKGGDAESGDAGEGGDDAAGPVYGSELESGAPAATTCTAYGSMSCTSASAACGGIVAGCARTSAGQARRSGAVARSSRSGDCVALGAAARAMCTRVGCSLASAHGAGAGGSSTRESAIGGVSGPGSEAGDPDQSGEVGAGDGGGVGAGEYTVTNSSKCTRFGASGERVRALVGADASMGQRLGDAA
jgi:hypothetical protein